MRLPEDMIGEVAARVSEGQTVRMYGTGFKVGSLMRVRARDRMQRPRIEVGSDEELVDRG